MAAELATVTNERKAISTAMAQCALAGFAVYELAVGGFLAACVDRTWYLPDAHSLAQFAQRVASGRVRRRLEVTT